MFYLQILTFSEGSWSANIPTQHARARDSRRARYPALAFHTKTDLKEERAGSETLTRALMRGPATLTLTRRARSSRAAGASGMRDASVVKPAHLT